MGQRRRPILRRLGTDLAGTICADSAGQGLRWPTRTTPSTTRTSYAGTRDVAVVEAAAAAQVEGVLVGRRGDERGARPGADDAAGEHRGPGERVVVAERVDRVVGGAEDRDRLPVHQRGGAPLDLELGDAADRLPVLDPGIAASSHPLLPGREPRPPVFSGCFAV